jgi:hypothetical protein
MKNKDSQNKRILHPLVITINLMIILVFGNALGVGYTGSAADAESEVPPPLVGVPSEIVNLATANHCHVELVKFGDVEFEKYKTFMEENFKNKSNTSSLMDLGMQRYEKFKVDIRSKLEVLAGQQLTYAGSSGGTNSAQIPGLSACETAARQYIEDAAKMLKIRAIGSSGIKKASIFVEKYKQINSKLRALDLDVMKMVVNLSTFEQKLPCYLKSCA